MVRFPKKQKANTKDEQLISFIDFAPTLLSLIDVEPPKYIQGQAFLGKHKAKQERKYIHAAADRFDAITDVIRAVRDDKFKYIRNYRPNQGYYLPVSYREQIPTMQELLRLRESGELNDAQAQWFRESKLPEELYDCEVDPFELNNLAANPAYQEKLKELSTEMDRWLANIGDEPNLPEAELISKLWMGSGSQPTTLEPIISFTNQKIEITCATEGASIGYKIIKKDTKEPKSWQVYQKPFALEKGESLLVKAHRIGFKSSSTKKSAYSDFEK
jgi:hypothetical protein